MSIVPLSDEPDHVAYDIQLNELHGRAHASRPAKLQTERFSTLVLARFAYCLANGVPTNASGAVVLGSPAWGPGHEAPDLSAFPAELPSRVAMSEDGLGLVEIHGAFKLMIRECKVPDCGVTFTQRRGARARARWNEVCGADCRREWGRLRKAAQRG